MGTDLTIIENQLVEYEPKWTQLVEAQGISPHQITQTVMVSLERLPKLLEADRMSLIQAATSAACLALPVDGVTGQGFLIPFGKKVQLVIGYKGYNTMAGRSGFIINGDVVREEDEFDYDKGSKAFVHHKPKLGHRLERPIIGAYAVAVRPGWANMVEVLDIDELLAVKAKSPGARKSDSPWNDPKIGLPAMMAKTAKRRLGRAMPLNIGQPAMHQAAVMEEAFDERGLSSYIHPDKGVMIEGEAQPLADTIAPTPDEPPVSTESPYVFKYPQRANRPDRRFPTIEQWAGFWTTNAKAVKTAGAMDELLQANGGVFENLRASYPNEVDAVMANLAGRKTDLLAKS